MDARNQYWRKAQSAYTKNYPYKSIEQRNFSVDFNKTFSQDVQWNLIRNSRFQSFVSNYGGFRYKEVMQISKVKGERCTRPHADSEIMQFIQRNQ